MCRLIYDVISDVILLNFTNFTTSSPFWTTRIDFYEICIRSKVLWYDQRKILAICFFDTMSVFLIYVVVNDVILLCFTDSTTSSPFWATSLYSYGIFIISKVVQHDQRKILAIYFYDTMTYEDLLTSYCSVSLILPLHRLLSIFTWFLENVYHSSNYSTWSEEYFSKMNFLYLVSLLTYDVIFDVVLFYLFPIKIRTPLIFAHIACAKIKGSKFAQYECTKIKGRRTNATTEWKNGKFTVI